MVGKRVKSFFWWTYYGLFLGICIFVFVTVLKYVKGLLFTGTGGFNLGKFLYGVAVVIMIFGLLSMAIAYLVKALWIRIAGTRRGI